MTTSLPPHARRTLRSWLWRYRPLLVALLLAVAAWAALGALRPAPGPTETVVVAAGDLAPGHLISAADLATVELPPGAAPPSALNETAGVIGDRIAHPLARGTPITPEALVGSGAWSAADPGELVVPVRLADPAVAGILPRGTAFQLVAATGSGPTLLTERARLVAAVPDSAQGSGLLGSGGASGGTLLLVAVPSEVATLVLDASAGGTLSIALARGD